MMMMMIYKTLKEKKIVTKKQWKTQFRIPQDEAE